VAARGGVFLGRDFLVGLFSFPKQANPPNRISRERITSFLHPEEDARAPAITFAIGRLPWFRRLLGKGFRNGSQNQLGYIPSGIRISSCRRGLKNRD